MDHFEGQVDWVSEGIGNGNDIAGSPPYYDPALFEDVPFTEIFASPEIDLNQYNAQEELDYGPEPLDTLAYHPAYNPIHSNDLRLPEDHAAASFNANEGGHLYGPFLNHMPLDDSLVPIAPQIEREVDQSEYPDAHPGDLASWQDHALFDSTIVDPELFSGDVKNQNELITKVHNELVSDKTREASPPIGTPNLRQITAKKTWSKFSNRARTVLRTWLDKHIRNPYPKPREKKALASSTGLTEKQVSSWFNRTRARKIPNDGVVAQYARTINGRAS